MRFAWIDERPFNYEEDGALTGCDVELARRAFAALGEPFEPTHTTFPQLLSGLQDNRWDVTTGMFVTAERQSQAFFTRPIWSLRDGLLVAQANRHISGYAALAHEQLPVAVLTGQVQRDHALRLGVDLTHLIEFDDYTDAAAAVLEGTVAAYASVALAHEEHLATLPEQQRTQIACIPIPTAEVTPAPGAFACASDEIRAALDRALADLLPPGDPGEPSTDASTWLSDGPGN